MDKQKYQDALRLLLQQLEAYSPFGLAFSGGLDSRFLAHISHTHSLPFTAFHVRGPHIPKQETFSALKWLHLRRIPVTEIRFNPLTLYDVRHGTENRCYACKKAIFSRIFDKGNGEHIIDGSNASDLKQFRPGLRALKEFGVISPLAICGLGKIEIKILAEQTGLDNPDQPSRPCLLTRLDYNLAPSEDLLSRIEEAEQAVAAMGFSDFRLRISQKEYPLLQVAWEEAQKMEEKKLDLSIALAKLGFEKVNLRADISLSGYFDKQSSAHDQN